MSFCNFNSKSDGRRYEFFFSFKLSCSLSTSKSCAKTPLPDSFECFFDPQRSFGNPLPALFLKNRNFFCYGEIFLPNTWGTSRMPPRVLAVWAKTLRGQLLRLFFQLNLDTCARTILLCARALFINLLDVCI